MRCSVLAIAALSTGAVHAQWAIQDSHTTANLRGIHSLGNGVVWASGANGTVLRTIDSGRTWQTCSVPPGAKNLDFRGIQGFDKNTAIVMSAGPGDLSRLYRTTDGCSTWSLLFTNPDKEGFWDAIQFSRPDFGVLIGDPVQGQFPLFYTTNRGRAWRRRWIATAGNKQGIFAASNSSLFVDSRHNKLYFITGAGTTALMEVDIRSFKSTYTHPELATGESAGGFSLASRTEGSNLIIVAVGGDYKSPDNTAGTAATYIYDRKGNAQWRKSDVPPGGYRSAVAYDAKGKNWVAVGPNGTDVSDDDGRTWRPLKPTAGEPSGADRNWNALSLPFVVGPDGRIGLARKEW